MNKIDIISEVINGFISLLTHEEALNLALRRIKNTFECKSCAVITIDNSGCPKIKTAIGLSNDYIKSFYTGCRMEIVNDVFRIGKKVLITKGHPMLNKEGYRFEHDYKSLFLVPLLMHGDIIGVMYMDSVKGKPFSDNEKDAFIQIANLCSIILDHEANLNRLQSASILDSMTGLYNHRHFHEELAREVKRALRSKHPVSLLIASIGHMSEYNSVYGHIAGDKAIASIAEIFEKSIRDIDIAARYGNRLAVVFPEIDSSSAKGIAERIIDKFTSSFNLKEKTPAITLRIGIASFPKDADNAAELIKSAEKNVFESKRKGGNSITVS